MIFLVALLLMVWDKSGPQVVERYATGLIETHTMHMSATDIEVIAGPKKDKHNLTGRKFNRWTVSGIGTRKNGWEKYWLCVCECGQIREVLHSNLTGGKSKSCGCLIGEVTTRRNKTDMVIHGMSQSREFKAWSAILSRCNNPNLEVYQDYGARGITVCDRWNKGESGLVGFQCFYLDVGPCPTNKHTIDRIDNDGNYEPGNCRWSTMREQCQNKRNTLFFEVDGKRMSITQMADKYGVDRDRLCRRLTTQKMDPKTAIANS